MDIVDIWVNDYRLPAHVTKDNTIRDWTAAHANANVNNDSGSVTSTTAIVGMSTNIKRTMVNSLSLFVIISPFLFIFIHVLLFEPICPL